MSYLRRLLAPLTFGLIVAAAAATVATSVAVAATPAEKRSQWSDLTPEQKQILSPLAGEWDQLDAPRRAKWLGIAKRYPQMTPTSQKRVQNRMAEWVRLTPEERRMAREQYRKIGKLPPEKRETVVQEWAEYQQLPADVKRRLAAEPQKKPETRESRVQKKTAANAKQSAPSSSPASSLVEYPSPVDPPSAN